MSTSISPLLASSTIAIYLLTLVVPGLLLGAASGLRGWLLVGLSPLLSYSIAGVAGPWLTTLHIPFTVLTFTLMIVLFTALAFGFRRLSLRRYRSRNDGKSPIFEGIWARRGHIAVAACLVVGVIIGGYTVLAGIGHLNAVPQGFDAVYHANGIRYIAETGDASLTGSGQPNWYAESGGLFYPNAYHLIGALVYSVSGATIPAILNVNTLLLPGLLGLSLVTVVRAFRGRAVFAGSVALLAIAPTTALYESMDRGPLLPYLLGIALTPLGAVAFHRYLVRPAMDTGFLFIAVAVGLLCVHSSTLFGGILFALPVLGQRWVRARGTRLRVIGKDLLALLPIAASSLFVAWLQLFGALGLANSDIPYWGWDNETPINQAVGELLTFQHIEPLPQIWLSLALLLGFVFFGRIGQLRWIGATALLTGAFYVAVASTDSELMMALSRPWWNDPFRFLSMAAVPITVIAAHGVAETQAWLRDKLAGFRVFAGSQRSRGWLGAGSAVVLLAGFVAASGTLYSWSNAQVVARGYGTSPGVDKHTLPVSPDETAAMNELAKRAKPHEWAMNDRFDGTAWTYAISGVRTVSGHFDPALTPRIAQLLENRFHDYQTDPEVQAAVEELNIRWVIVGQFGYPGTAPREEGLVGLDELPFLDLVYRNSDASLYRLTPA